MKRSEAAAKIRELLVGTPIQPDFEYQILEAVESIGMLPPEITDYTTSLAINLNEWEPEDEEK